MRFQPGDKVRIVTKYQSVEHYRRHETSRQRVDNFMKDGIVVKVVPENACSIRIRFSDSGVSRSFANYGIEIIGETIFDV